jgi:head-tail adaptor
MGQVQRQHQRIVLVTVIFLALGLFSGCTGIGPRTITKGRADYNEAINTTEDEQMLMAIVKGRYGDSATLLAVSSISASVSFASRASINAGFGPEKNYTGNLVPFSGGLVYEENPTITYSPVNDEKYIRQIMTPIPLEIFFMSLRTIEHRKGIMYLWVTRINNLRNPAFFQDKAGAMAGQFNDFVTLWTELQNDDVIELMTASPEMRTFDVVINNKGDAYAEKVRRLLALLDLQAPETGFDEMTIPVSFMRRQKDKKGITIGMRSTMGLIEILRAAVEVPLEHEKAHLTITYPAMGNPGKGVRIRSSLDKPGGMSTAVKYRGYWFYIDETDQHTKQVFRLLRVFWSFAITGSIDEDSAPVLTLPVSK